MDGAGVDEGDGEVDGDGVTWFAGLDAVGDAEGFGVDSGEAELEGFATGVDEADCDGDEAGDADADADAEADGVAVVANAEALLVATRLAPVAEAEFAVLTVPPRFVGAGVADVVGVGFTVGGT